jgi:hypothetical protein
VIAKDESYNNDSILEGKSNIYYFDGSVNEEINYHNGKIHGLYKKNYENGKIAKISEYKNGIEKGEFFTFYTSGIFQSGGFKKNGHLFGESYLYFEDGKTKAWHFSTGECISYERKFDTSGLVISDKGIPMLQVYDETNYRINDTLKTDYYFGVFLGCKGRLKVADVYNKRATNVMDYSIDENAAEDHWYKFKSIKFPIKGLGEHYLVATLFIKDLKYNRNDVYCDTFKYLVNQR